MLEILTSNEMKKVDEYSINELGIPSTALMESAARAVAAEIEIRYKCQDNITAVCGIGNNGADGVAVIRTLKAKGYENVSLFVLGDINKATKEFIIQLDIAKKLSIEIIFIKDIQDISFDAYDVIVDAIFGIGLKREVTGIYSDIIEKINRSKAVTYAVDIPSGIDGNNGDLLNSAIKADYTITFGNYKAGLLLYPGAEYAGNIIVCDIGFPLKAYSERDIIYSYTKEDLPQIFPKRINHSNKGTYGKLLIIAGNEDMYGALYMCSRAAFAMGAGLVKIITTKENKQLINDKLPEAIVVTIDNINYSEIVKDGLNWCDTVLVGPGIGISKRSEDIVRLCLKAYVNTIIDADGINVLSNSDELKGLLHSKTVITPHLGEASRFTGLPVADISKNLIDICRENSKKYGISIVLKDARTVICNTLGEIYINIAGNSGMAKAGSGDVLAGILAGLVATGTDINKAASAASFIHSTAGDMAKAEYGEYAMLPTDIISALKLISNISK